MITNLIETTIVQVQFNEQYYLIFYEPNMCESFYAYLIQPNIDDIIKEKIFRLIKILLYKIKKVSDKYKSRLRIDAYGGINGLISKMLSNTAYFQTYLSTNKLISEKFLFNLIDICLDLCNTNHEQTNPLHLKVQSVKNKSPNVPIVSSQRTTSLSSPPKTASTTNENNTPVAQITNFDGLWTILSLLTPSTLCLNNYWHDKIDALIELRLKVCNLLIKYITLNSNSLQFLVKSNGWQDILCQFLCYKHKISENNELKQPKQEEEKQSFDQPQQLEVVQNDKQEANNKSIQLTSTPTVNKLNSMRKIFSNEFKKYSSTSSTTSSLPSNDDSINVNSNNLNKIKSFDENDELTNNNNNNKNSSLIIAVHDNNNTKDDRNGANNEIEMSKIRLCDKIVHLIFKLTFYGITGSSESAWKVYY